MASDYEDDEPNEEEILCSLIYDLYPANSKHSWCFEILVDYLGGIYIQADYEDYILGLISVTPDLQSFAQELAHEVLEWADRYHLAPWDGTLDEEMEEGDTYFDYTAREYLLPFLKDWHQEVRKKTKELWLKHAREKWGK